MSFKLKLVPLVLPILLTSCVTSIGDYDDGKSGSGTTLRSSSSGNSGGLSSSGGSGSSSSGLSSSGGSGSSSSVGGGSSSSVGGGLSSSPGIVFPSSSAVYNGDEFCDANPPEQPDPPVFGNPFVDSRDNKRYETVKIGNQIWITANMDYKPSSGNTKCYGQGAVDPNVTPTWLSEQQAQANCDKYGRLYDWAAARTACPSGWRLPTRDDWNKLMDFVEDELFQNCEDYWFDWDVATRLKATSGWKPNGNSNDYNGKDYYGFNAIGGGFCVNCNESSLTAGSGYYSGVELNYKTGGGTPASFNPALNQSVNATWWSDTQHNAADAFAYEMTYDKQVMNEKRHSKTEYLLSVRCIRN